MTGEGMDSWLVGLLAVLAARGLLVFLAAYAVTALARGLSSEARHLIWLGVIGSFAVFPLAWLMLPPLEVAAWIPRLPLEPGGAYGIGLAPVISHDEYLRLAQQVRGLAHSGAQPQTALRAGGMLALLAVWGAGAATLAARPFLGARTLRRLAAGARESPRLEELVGRLAGRSSTRAGTTVLLSDRCAVPFTFGVRRPVIVLPASAPGWPALRIQSALIHELAHVQRRDVLTQSMAYCVCVVFWFIPPLWLAYAAMLREADACCDQQVINQGIRGAEYARDIVDLARSCRGRMLLPCVSGAVGGITMLKKRVKKVLGLKPRRSVFGARGAAAVLLVFLCCLVPLLALTCATGPGVRTDDPLLGTWINEKYDAGNAERAARIVSTSDGRQLDYRHIGDTEPLYEGTFVVEEKWVDAEGYHWYKIHFAGKCCRRGNPYSKNTLARVNPAGTIREANYSGYGGYPDVAEFGRTGPGYSILYRQQ